MMRGSKATSPTESGWKGALAIYAVASTLERASEVVDVDPVLLPACFLACCAASLALALFVLAKPAGGALVADDDFDAAEPERPPSRVRAALAVAEFLAAASLVALLGGAGVVAGVRWWVELVSAMPPWVYGLGCALPAVFVVGYHEGSRAQGDVYAALARGEPAPARRADSPGVVRYDPLFPSHRAMSRPKSDGNLRRRQARGLDAIGLTRAHSSGKLHTDTPRPSRRGGRRRA